MGFSLPLRNLAPDVKNWEKIFYNNVTRCVLNNGHASEFFALERGVRQGYPLSGLLFVKFLQMQLEIKVR